MTKPPSESFALSHDYLTGEPLPPTPPREPIDPAAKPGDPSTTRKAKAIIRKHQRGLK